MNWVQGPIAGVGSKYPECPDCNIPMTVPLLQFVEQKGVSDKFVHFSLNILTLTLILINSELSLLVKIIKAS